MVQNNGQNFILTLFWSHGTIQSFPLKCVRSLQKLTEEQQCWVLLWKWVTSGSVFLKAWVSLWPLPRSCPAHLHQHKQPSSPLLSRDYAAASVILTVCVAPTGKAALSRTFLWTIAALAPEGVGASHMCRHRHNGEPLHTWNTKLAHILSGPLLTTHLSFPTEMKNIGRGLHFMAEVRKLSFDRICRINGLHAAQYELVNE